MANTIKQKRGTTDPSASDLVVGELAINTTDGGVFTKTDGGTVVEVGAGGGGISNVVEDTTPQLGGDLDLNSNTINGTGDIDITGAITATGAIFVKSYKDTTHTLSGTDIDPANGGIQTKVCSANTTLTDSLSAGESVVLHVEGGGSYTITWPTITWVTSSGNSAPTLTAKDVVVLWKISTTLYGAYAGSYA
jgi:hypothetical protein